MSAHPEVAAVIMAGGKSSRLGGLGQAGSKCLLGLPDDQTLLSRLVSQLRMAQIGKTVVCCSSENFSAIDSFLHAHRARAGIPKAEVEAAVCDNCSVGPRPALAEALGKVRAPWYLLCLADVVFATPPFVKALGHLSKRKVDGLLISGADQMGCDGAGSGFVDCEQRTVRAISYRPFGSRDLTVGRYRRWSGSFFFREELLLKHGNDLLKHRAAPFENWIQELLEQGAPAIQTVEPGPLKPRKTRRICAGGAWHLDF